MSDKNRIEVEIVASAPTVKPTFDQAAKAAEEFAKKAGDQAKKAGGSSPLKPPDAAEWLNYSVFYEQAAESQKKLGLAGQIAAGLQALFADKTKESVAAARGLALAGKDAFTALSTGNMGAAASSIGHVASGLSAISPVAAAAAVGVIGLAAGFAYLATEAIRAAERARDITNSYILIGRAGEYSRLQVEAITRELRAMGASKDDAASIVAAIQGIPFASDTTRESLARLAKVYAELSKKEPAEAARELAQAFAGGVGALRDFADRLNLLTPEEKKAMEQAALANDVFAAQEIVVRALNARFSAQIQHLRELKKVYDDLKTSTFGSILYGLGLLESTVRGAAQPPTAGQPRAPSAEDSARLALENRYNRALIERRAIERDIAELERLRKDATSESRKAEIDTLIEVARRRREAADQSLGQSVFQSAEQDIARFRAAHAGNIGAIARFEAETWKKLAEDHTLSRQAREDAERRYAAARSQAARSGRGDALAQFKLDTDLARMGSEQRVEFARKELEAARRIYGQKSAQAAESEKRLTEAMKAAERERTQDAIAQAQVRNQRRFGDMDLLEREVAFRRQVGAISAAEEAALLRQMALERYQIQLKALQDELALQREKPEEMRRILLEIEKLYNEHRLRLQQIDNQTRLETINTYKGLASSIQSATASSISGLISGQVTGLQALQNIGTAALSALVNFGIQQLGEWLTQQLLVKTMQSAASTVAAYGQIANNAAVAASAAYASTAAIPVIGPSIAPGVAAQAYATTLAYAGFVTPFAERGYDVDRDGLAFLHKKEMVLPQQYGDVIRAMAGTPEGGAPGPLIGSINFSYQGGWTRRQVMESADMLAAAMADRLRGFDRRLQRAQSGRI